MGEVVFLSREQVTKYFEVRMFSLAVIAFMMCVVFIFLLFLFVSRGQYVYAVAIAAVAIIMVIAALKMLQYGKMFRRSLRESKKEQKDSIR